MRSLWELDQAMHGKRLGTRVRLMSVSLLYLLKGTDNVFSFPLFIPFSETKRSKEPLMGS